MATSWGQRKALGRRYAIDPALQIEQDRLAQQYALIPGREARALEAERIAYAKQNDEENRKAAEKSGMVGTVGNLATTGLTMRALTKEPGTPFFGEWGKGATNVMGATEVAPAITSSIAPVESFGITGSTAPASLTGTAGEVGSGMTFTGSTPQIAPALVDSTATGVGAAGTGTGSATPAITPIAETGATGAAAAGAPVTATGAAWSGITAAGAYAPYVALAKGVGMLTRKLSGDTDPNNPKNDYFSRTGRVAEKADQGLFIPVTKELGIDTPISDIALGLANPAGWALSELCIIITACTDKHSPEVETAREYRNRHMDPLELRGYYMIAEKIVPVMCKYQLFNRFVKWALVDKIIDYCQYAIGQKKTLPKPWSVFVMKSFIGLCGFSGAQRSEYTRINGEVF